MIQLKSEREIERMARAGSLVADAFRRIAPMVQAGCRTRQIDEEIRDYVRGRGGELLFYQYKGFPAHSCISVNEEVVHGIPGERVLRDGDIVSIDVGVRIDGFCGDSARTFFVGEPSPKARQVVECCREALRAGIEAMQKGGQLSDVSRAIEEAVGRRSLHVVEKYVGHGIGREMHEEPQVPNFVGPAYDRLDMPLQPGLVLAIEPMVNEGTSDVRTGADGWTVVTADGGLSAHCEHTVAVTESGPRILTDSSDLE
ncbi:MAG: type I methionyl aminopeptidase [Planctomycetota bacterium]